MTDISITMKEIRILSQQNYNAIAAEVTKGDVTKREEALAKGRKNSILDTVSGTGKDYEDPTKVYVDSNGGIDNNGD